MTTIQIKGPTKKALFLTKNRLEAILGRSLTYDDVINHLMKTSQIEKVPNRSFREYRGILGKRGRSIYQELRQEELANEFPTK